MVVPHYNYGSYLPVAVESALGQPGVIVELILVDDASNDGSLEVARRLAASDSRITLVEHARNMRHIRTYNDGLSRATGDYVVLLSADDALTPGSLSRSVALMETHPAVALVYGAVESFADTVPPHVPRRSWWQVWSGEQWVSRVAQRGRNAIVNPEAVMRRSVFADIGGYDPDLPHAGDMYMWLQAAARGAVGFVGGPRQAFYRDHGLNMHATEFAGLLDDMEQARSVFERFFTEGYGDRSRARGLLDTARYGVAREALLRGVLLVVQGSPRDCLSTFQHFARETSPAISGSATWRWSQYVWAHAESPELTGLVRRAEAARWAYRATRQRSVGL